MDILVVSDTHGSGRLLAEVVEAHPRVECIAHLGDSQWTEPVLCANCAPLSVVAVGGNCDAAPFPALRILELEGVRVLLVHGHRHGARFGTEGLVALARENRADVVLYGHTHVAGETWEEIPGEGRRVYLCNPGSLAQPRDGAPSYGVLTLRAGKALFSVARMEREFF